MHRRRSREDAGPRGNRAESGQTDVARSQSTDNGQTPPEAGRGRKDPHPHPSKVSEAALPCQHLNFRLPASRTMREHISIVLSHAPRGTLLAQPRKPVLSSATISDEAPGPIVQSQSQRLACGYSGGWDKHMAGLTSLSLSAVASDPHKGGPVPVTPGLSVSGPGGWQHPSREMAASQPNPGDTAVAGRAKAFLPGNSRNSEKEPHR